MSEAVPYVVGRVRDDGVGEVGCSFDGSVVHRATCRASPSEDLVVPVDVPFGSPWQSPPPEGTP